MRRLRRLKPLRPATSATFATSPLDGAESLRPAGRDVLRPPATSAALTPDAAPVAGGRGDLRPKESRNHAASEGQVAEVAEVAAQGPLPYPPGWRGWPDAPEPPALDLPDITTAPLGRCRSCRYRAPLSAAGACGKCEHARILAAAERAVLSPDALADEAEVMLRGEIP
jgi:hypothetical protein